MKHLLLMLSFVTAAIVPQARAADSLPYFGSLRTEVVHQLTLASNNVTANKQLISALNGALRTLDKTQPTYVAGAKSLGVLAKALNRTSVSNVFDPILQSTVDTYISSLTDAEGSLATRLAATFPSKPKTATQTTLGQVLAALSGANTNSNVILAAKFLGTASTKLTGAEKSTISAEHVPAPPASITANVTGAVTINGLKTTGAVIASYPNNVYIVNGAQVTTRPLGQRQLAFGLAGVTEGTHTINITGGDLSIIQIPASGRAFVDGAGTATVTYNPASKSMFGTFTFTAKDQDAPASTITVTGSFNGVTTP